jgi:hypothetical protein
MRILFRRDGDPVKQERKDKLMSFVGYDVGTTAQRGDDTITIKATYEDWILLVDDLKTGARLLEEELERIEQEIADPNVEGRQVLYKNGKRLFLYKGTVEANAPFVKAIRKTIAKRFERAEAISKLAEEEETIE